MRITGQAPPNEWTVLCFLNARGNLQPDVERTIRQLESVGSGDRIQFVTQVAYEHPYPTADRSLIKKSSWLGFLPHSQSQERPVKSDPSDPGAFKEFLCWGMKKFPARHYLVIVESHGQAVCGLSPNPEAGTRWSLPGFKQAIDGAVSEVGQPIDILALDACLMGSVETAYAVKDSVGYLAASEELVKSDNLRYATLARNLRQEVEKGDLPVAGALTHLQEARRNRRLSTASVIDCSQLEELANRMRPFARELLAVSAEQGKQTFEAAQHFRQPAVQSTNFAAGPRVTPMSHMRDLVSVAKRVEGAAADSELARAAREVTDFVEHKVVLAEDHQDRWGLTDSHGLSIYAPTEVPRTVLEAYQELSFAKATGWDQVVEKFGSNGA